MRRSRSPFGGIPVPVFILLVVIAAIVALGGAALEIWWKIEMIRAAIALASR